MGTDKQTRRQLSHPLVEDDVLVGAAVVVSAELIQRTPVTPPHTVDTRQTPETHRGRVVSCKRNITDYHNHVFIVTLGLFEINRTWKTDESRQTQQEEWPKVRYRTISTVFSNIQASVCPETSHPGRSTIDYIK